MAVNIVKRNGSYAPLSATYYKDEVLVDVGPLAELLYVRGLAFCAEVLSDGHISDTQFSRFVGGGIPQAKRHAQRLVDSDLWQRNGNGYIVRSWLKWNASREEIREKQRKDSERKTGGQR